MVRELESLQPKVAENFTSSKKTIKNHLSEKIKVKKTTQKYFR
jgi:hypothetical protein